MVTAIVYSNSEPSTPYTYQHINRIRCALKLLGPICEWNTVLENELVSAHYSDPSTSAFAFYSATEVHCFDVGEITHFELLQE